MGTMTVRIISGVQPSGQLHLGNYLGAIRMHLALQKQDPKPQIFLFIADYHALTTIHDPQKLQTYVREAAATYLALGLNPDRAILFRQSSVPEVTELAWLLATATGKGLLDRSPSYKDKLAHGIMPSVGLYFYPMLMAADILAYGGAPGSYEVQVPVGRDQLPHIELAQDVATRFNETYGPTLTRPEPLLAGAGVIPGLDGRKMSKSYGNTIPIFDPKPVSRIVTDMTPMGQPLPWTTCTVAALLRELCDPDEIMELEEAYRTGSHDGKRFGYGHAKQRLIQALDREFAHSRERYAHYLYSEEGTREVDKALQASAHFAGEVAGATLKRCRVACGLA